MKKHLGKLLENDWSVLLMSGVFGYTTFNAVIKATLGVPPEAILDSELQEILLIFEG